MKPINVIFEDSEMEALKKVKGDKTWHDFILELSQKRYSSTDLTRIMFDEGDKK